MSLLACAAVGLLLLQLYNQSTAAQVRRSEAVAAATSSMSPAGKAARWTRALAPD